MALTYEQVVQPWSDLPRQMTSEQAQQYLDVYLAESHEARSCLRINSIGRGIALMIYNFFSDKPTDLSTDIDLTVEKLRILLEHPSLPDFPSQELRRLAQRVLTFVEEAEIAFVPRKFCTSAFWKSNRLRQQAESLVRRAEYVEERGRSQTTP